MTRIPPVMVIEENPDDFYLINRRLEAAGVKNHVISFFDGDDAIRHLERALAASSPSGIPCVIFTDLKLLGSDGFQVAEWCRHQPGLNSTKIVILTGSQDPAHLKRAVEIGVDQYLIKFPEARIFTEIVASAVACFPRVEDGQTSKAP